MADDAENKAECERIFKHFDTDGDDKISLAELVNALKALNSASHDEAEQRMAQIDTDQDGFISFEELLAFQRANSELMKKVAEKI